MEKNYPCGVVFKDGKAQLPKNAKFAGVKSLGREPNTSNMKGSWFKEYKNYIVDFVIDELDDEELMKFSIIFKFPNGFGAVVEFESDNTKTLDDYYTHAININVEMLDKNGEKFTDESYERNRISRFPYEHREELVLPYQVEHFLETVRYI